MHKGALQMKKPGKIRMGDRSNEKKHRSEAKININETSLHEGKERRKKEKWLRDEFGEIHTKK